MKKVFTDAAALEKAVKERFSIPDFLMMENAAQALAMAVLNRLHSITKDGDIASKSVFIACGNGNNGADGLALARKLHTKCIVHIFCPVPPKTIEGSSQHKMASSLGCQFVTSYSDEDIFVDCVFGTGFHGEVPPQWQELFAWAESSYRIACDIPSGLSKDGHIANGSFIADETVTMGSLKLALLSDPAKDIAGKITVAELGLSENDFTALNTEDIYLVEDSDITLPLRNTENTHKGNYGHVAVTAGEKSGAAILSATAALESGAGLVTIVNTPDSNLAQFAVDPSLMISSSYPANASSFVIGSGLGRPDEIDSVSAIINNFETAFSKVKSSSVVLDADILYHKDLPSLLERLTSGGGRVILTPHAKELAHIAVTLGLYDDYLAPALALEKRVEIGKRFCEKYKNCALIMKGANTYFAVNNKIFIQSHGGPCLSKAGSGDVLGGVIASLLAQGYSLEDACITGTGMFGMAAEKYGKNRFDLTALKLCRKIGNH